MKLYLTIFAGLIAVTAAATEWRFDQGKLPDSGKMFAWPDNSMAFSFPADPKTPDGRSVLAITAQGAVGHPHARQLVLICPNTFAPKAKLRLQFWAKASSPTNIVIQANQLNAPYEGLSDKLEETVKLTHDWQKYTRDLELKNHADDPKFALPRLGLGVVPAGETVYLGPVSVEAADEETLLNLHAAANMGFADDKAGDGKGGWTDQGPGMDMRDFDVKAKEFCAIPFAVIDPSTNQGKSVITFGGTQFTNGVKTAVITTPGDTKGKYLYLLHSSAWTPKLPAAVGEITVNYSDKSSDRFTVQSGRELNDWWNPTEASNGFVAYANANNLGIYFSQFNLNPAKTVTEIRFDSAQNGIWVVVAASIGNRSPQKIKAEPAVITAGKNWRPVDTGDLRVKAGSALDFSHLVTNPPVSELGRVVVNHQNRLAVASRPDQAVRFRCAAVAPVTVFDKLTLPQLSEFAEMVRRQGYNMVRIGGEDIWLAGQYKQPYKVVDIELGETPDAIKFVPENLDKLDFFIAELAKRGIYVYLDGMGSPIGYAPNANAWVYPGFGYQNNGIGQLLDNPKWRNHWRSAVTKWLSHVNPYTKLPLTQDPVVMAINYTNEQDILLGMMKCVPQVLDHKWKQYLTDKYTTFDRLYVAWQGQYGTVKLDRNGGFSAVPALDVNVAYGKTQAGIDITLFLSQTELEMTRFYRQVYRGIGGQSLDTMWDFIPRLLEVPARSNMDIVSMHNYHAHPTSYRNQGSKISQESSLKLGGNGFKQFPTNRLLERAFLVTEYGNVYWNRYRHEQGLLFGAGAAFQEFDAINLHSEPVMLAPNCEIRPFTNSAVDPINRASEIVTAFAYLRGDVAPAKHTVAFALDNRGIFEGQAMFAFGDELSLLWPVCKIGLNYLDGKNHQIKSDLVLKNGALSNIRYQVGAAGTESSGGKASLKEAINALRQNKLISDANPTNADTGILASDTGEIKLDMTNGVLQVVTPRLEGVTVKRDQEYALGALTIRSCSVPATVTLVCLDDKQTIRTGDRLLLIFATDALNSKMEFTSFERKELVNNGELPVLVETGKLKVTVTAKAGEVTVYPLKLTGERQAPLPASRTPDGKIAFAVDTATMPGEPALYYEIVIK